MNVEKLKRLQEQVRIGGKGTPRRKKKVIHQTAVTDDKKLQGSLKKLSVSTIPGIEEVNIIKDDLTVIHFNNPKTQASLSANTFAVTGHGENKKIVEMLPEILPQLGQDTVMQLRMFANSMSNTLKGKPAAAGTNPLTSVLEEEDDDVPMLVNDFDEIAKVEAEIKLKATSEIAKKVDKKEGTLIDESSIIITEPPLVYENKVEETIKPDVKKFEAGKETEPVTKQKEEVNAGRNVKKDNKQNKGKNKSKMEDKSQPIKDLEIKEDTKKSDNQKSEGEKVSKQLNNKKQNQQKPQKSDKQEQNKHASVNVEECINNPVELSQVMANVSLDKKDKAMPEKNSKALQADKVKNTNVNAEQKATKIQGGHVKSEATDNQKIKKEDSSTKIEAATNKSKAAEVSSKPKEDIPKSVKDSDNLRNIGQIPNTAGKENMDKKSSHMKIEQGGPKKTSKNVDENNEKVQKKEIADKLAPETVKQPKETKVSHIQKKESNESIKPTEGKKENETCAKVQNKADNSNTKLNKSVEKSEMKLNIQDTKANTETGIKQMEPNKTTSSTEKPIESRKAEENKKESLVDIQPKKQAIEKPIENKKESPLEVQPKVQAIKNEKPQQHKEECALEAQPKLQTMKVGKPPEIKKEIQLEVQPNVGAIKTQKGEEHKKESPLEKYPNIQTTKVEKPEEHKMESPVEVQPKIQTIKTEKPVVENKKESPLEVPLKIQEMKVEKPPETKKEMSLEVQPKVEVMKTEKPEQHKKESPVQAQQTSQAMKSNEKPIENKKESPVEFQPKKQAMKVEKPVENKKENPSKVQPKIQTVNNEKPVENKKESPMQSHAKIEEKTTEKPNLNKDINKPVALAVTVTDPEILKEETSTSAQVGPESNMQIQKEVQVEQKPELTKQPLKKTSVPQDLPRKQSTPPKNQVGSAASRTEVKKVDSNKPKQNLSSKTENVKSQGQGQTAKTPAKSNQHNKPAGPIHNKQAEKPGISGTPTSKPITTNKTPAAAPTKKNANTAKTQPSAPKVEAEKQKSIEAKESKTATKSSTP